MDDKEKEFVWDYNAKVKHGESLDKFPFPTGITVANKARRTSSSQDKTKARAIKQESLELSTRKRKGITFGVSESDIGVGEDE